MCAKLWSIEKGMEMEKSFYTHMIGHLDKAVFCETKANTQDVNKCIHLLRDGE